MRFLLFIIVLIVCQFSCSRPSVPQVNCFEDPVYREIASLADARNTQGLLTYLSHAESRYKTYAAQCFGSFGDSIPVQALLPLVTAPDTLLSTAAAWAIGQKYDSLWCDELIAAWHQNQNNGEILSAIAKSTPSQNGPVQQQTIAFFEQLSLANPSVTSSFCDAIYHLHYRGIYTVQGLDKLLATYLPSNDLWVRKAQAIGRYRGIMREEHSELLLSYLDRSLHPDIALALIPVLLNISDTTATHYIHQKLMNDSMDVRVELLYTNVILRKCKMDENILMDIMENVGHRAQLAIMQQAVVTEISDSFGQYLSAFTFEENALKAYASYFKMKANELTEAHFLEQYHQVPEGYDRIPYVTLLAQCSNGQSLLFNEIISTAHLGLRYALTEEWTHHTDAKSEEMLVQLWNLQDIGLMALLCEMIPNQIQIREDHNEWLPRLEQQLQTLILPQEIETYEAVRLCLEKLDPQNRKKPDIKSNHAIDWALVSRIPRDARVTVETDLGSFVIQLNIEIAPGSVANFVALVQQGYYDQKYFHRMVPNFVLQGGCPRGDGMGSTPYTIRSEFSRLTYTTGTVGLASSGRDTESCQWFVSHLATPHLDGRYTIFGQVVEGMSTVHQLEVGHQIKSIKPLQFG